MWIFVTVGGATGALARYWLSGWVNVAFAGFFPIGTPVVNVLGSQVVDEEDRIQEVLPELDTMISGGLVTLEKARVILYRSGDS